MKYTVRLKKNKTLKYILKNGRYSTNKHLVVHTTENRNKNKNYFAVCVSKKNGISVHRNKLKRWARECYKFEEDTLKRGYNIVILYKKSANISNLSFEIVQKEIKNCLKELGLYEKK